MKFVLHYNYKGAVKTYFMFAFLLFAFLIVFMLYFLLKNYL